MIINKKKFILLLTILVSYTAFANDFITDTMIMSGNIYQLSQEEEPYAYDMLNSIGAFDPITEDIPPLVVILGGKIPQSQWAREGYNAIAGYSGQIKGAGSHNAILGGKELEIGTSIYLDTFYGNPSKQGITAPTTSAALIAGYKNTLLAASNSAILGGNNNVIEAIYSSAIIGGQNNIVSNYDSPVHTHHFSEFYMLDEYPSPGASLIIGGKSNHVRNDSSFIGGGTGNQNAGRLGCVIIASQNSEVHGRYNSILGGDSNLIGNLNTAPYGTSILGTLGIGTPPYNHDNFRGIPRSNRVFFSTIIGGDNNKIGGPNLVNAIIGGSNNYISREEPGTQTINGDNFGIFTYKSWGRSRHTLIVGGSHNTIYENVSYSSILGGRGHNHIPRNSKYVVILGGFYLYAPQALENEEKDTILLGRYNPSDSQHKILDMGIHPKYYYSSIGNLERISRNFFVREDGLVNFGGLSYTSDRRMKKNITPLEYGLAEVLALKPVKFQWKDQPITSTKDQHIGFISQDVEKILPEVVSEDGTEQKKQSVTYGNITAVLVNAIQEQQEQINQQQSRIDHLIDKLDNLLIN